MAKLNQIVAIESGVKTKTDREVSEVYKAVQHPTLFEGFGKQYRSLDEDGEKFPAESKNVQMTAQQVLGTTAKALTELFDVTAAKDFANCEAKADVEVDGTKLLAGVPVPYLLFLEKRLTDLHTLVGKIPVLDSAESWEHDQNANLFRTRPTETVKTKKVQKALVLYPATDKHPAQTQLITEDVTVGFWQTTKMSGAIAAPAKDRLLTRIEKLQRAVKFAREEANQADAPPRSVGEKIFSWLFAS